MREAGRPEAPSGLDPSAASQGAIAGRVLDDSGGAVAGARVLVPRDGAPSVHTDADGRFRIALGARPAYDLRAEAPGCGSSTAVAIPTGTTDLEFRLARETVLAGRVTFDGGAPAAGAIVEALCGATRAPDPFALARSLASDVIADASARCDENGEFRWHGLASGPYWIRLSGPGVRGTLLDRLVTAGGDRRDDAPIELVARRGALLTGHVVALPVAPVATPSGGSEDHFDFPISGAIVRVRPLEPSGTAWTSARTDADGRFTFDTLDPGPWTLDVLAGDDHCGARIDHVVAGAQDLRVVLPAPQSWHGRVVRAEDGSALAGAIVAWVDIADDGRARLAPQRVVVTDEAGRFTIRGLEAGAARLEIRASGRLTRAASRTELEGSPDRIARPSDARDGESPSIELRRAARISGRVIDTNGAAIARATVELVAWTDDRLALGPLTIASTLSTDSGEFACEASGARDDATLFLRATHPDHPPGAPSTPYLEDAGLDVDNVVVELHAGGALAGVVRDDDGPLGGVEVRPIASIEGETIELDRTATTDARGHFRLAGLAFGEYSLRIDARGYAPLLSERFTVLAGAETLQELALEREAAITGRVVDSDGRPIAASIEAIDVRRPGFVHGRRATATDQRGEFRLGSLHSGPYRLRVRAQGFATGALDDVFAPRDVEITLRAPGRIRGELVGASDGAPVTSARLTLVPATDTTRVHDALPSFVVATDGSFACDRVPPGAYRLLVDAPGFRPAAHEVVVHEDDDSPPIRIALDRGRTLAVAITDEAGEPIDGASVRALEVHDGRVRGARASDARDHPSADEHGRARVGGLDAGSWVVEASAPGFVRARSAVIELRSDEDADPPEVAIVLWRGTTLRGSVRDSAGAPVADGSVALIGSGPPRSAPIDANGSYRFDGVDPGNYRVQVLGRFRPSGPPQSVRIENGAGDVVLDVASE